MDALMRRRLMMMELGSSPTPPTPIEPELLYQNTSPITTALTDTGVNVLEPLISWTILVDATCNNYNWNQASSSQGLFGLNGNPRGFRLGKIYQGTGMVSNQSSGVANYYFAMSMDSTNTNPKCVTLYGRYNGVARRLFAIRYDSTTNVLFGVRDSDNNDTRWFETNGIPSNPGNIILLVGGISGATINDFKIYKGMLTNQQMFDYVNNF